MSDGSPLGPAGLRLRRTGNWVLDHPLPVVGALLAAALIAFFVARSGSPYQVRAVFASSLSLYPKQPVQIQGERVGQVKSVQLENGRGVVDLDLKEHYPLPQGTTAIIRFGSTLCEGCRYVELIPGPQSGPKLNDGGIIPERQTTTPVEFDNVFDTLDSRARGHLRGFIDNTSAATKGQSRQLSDAIVGTADTLDATSGLLHDLNSDRPALSALVTQADGATRTLAGRQRTIEDLLTVASTTFTEFGTRTAAVRSSLDQFAPTLVEARTTLGRANSTLDILDGLLADLKPGLAALHPFIAAARPVPGQLRVLSPLATRTLQVLSATAPSVTRLLRRGQPFSDRLQGVLGGLAPQLDCVRPYGPELASFFTQWTSWSQDYDNISHYGRVKGNSGATADTATPPTRTDQFLATKGRGLKYALPFPPGLSSGKPWFLPQCGAGPDSVDPSKDPEDANP